MHWKLLIPLSFSLLTAAVPLNSTRLAPCTHPGERVRREWRTLTKPERLEYINAVKCLQSKPSSGLVKKEAKSRFDDFQGVHIALSGEVHFVGQFLPWHRLYLYLYENALRDECGYQGYQPYWNWELDVSNGLDSFKASPVWDPDYGFGGNGKDIPGYSGLFGNASLEIPGQWRANETTGGGCIQDGPFQHYNLSLGPGTLTTNHCLTRSFLPTFLNTLTPEYIKNISSWDTFARFRMELEGAPVTETVRSHDGGHNSVGGEMFNVYSSPGDPVFYLHHAQVDKIWWDWQMVDPEKRLYAVAGVSSSTVPTAPNVTLDYPLKSMGLAPEIDLASVMDIRNRYLCYTYE